MSDRPDLKQLLNAVHMQIETNLLPAIRHEPRLYFQTLVALNLLKIGLRELTNGPQLLRAEWEAMDALTGEHRQPPERDGELAATLAERRRNLCAAIRQGRYDSPEDSSRLGLYVESVVSSQLVLNNPRLAERIAGENSENAYAK